MTSKDIREKFIKFFVERGHKEIAPAKLVPENDPTTLFTSSGMQPLVPYLLGQVHPEGKRLVDSQPSFRAEDIEEVGDNRHTTFFEMLGNWSLGDPARDASQRDAGGYFKKEQIPWFWEFLTKDLNLDPNKLYVSVFEGNESVPKDMETFEIWKSLGVSGDHIYFYGVDKNWWSRSGPPEKMPEGEIGGPDSEVFYEFTQVEDNPFAHYYRDCHPNCECGRFLEIGNSVFIQYQKVDRKLKELSQKNVDFGGGLERLTSAVSDNPDIFESDLFSKIINSIENISGRSYHDETVQDNMRIVADHLKAATFLIANGVIPSNKLQGYVLRRLLRRSAVKFKDMCTITDNPKDLAKVAASVIETYAGTGILEISKQDVEVVINEEMDRFSKTLDKGLREVEKITEIDGKEAFDLYQTFGFPYEVTEELFRQKGQEIDREQYKKEFEKHKELSRTASAGMFKGGLADHSEVVTKYHTATHLLHQALRDVLGPNVFQKGSNITSERLRFDFSFDRKMTDQEVKEVEEIINKRVEEDLVVDHKIVSLGEAKSLSAIGLFDEKYAEKVSIYGVGPNSKIEEDAKDKRERGGYYSLEFCGGPHVSRTNEIGKIKIVKEEAVSAGMRRIRAQLI